MAFNVIEVQPTPNPNAMKFVLDRPIAAEARSYFNVAMATGDALAEQLFTIEGVTSLLLLNDFVTVSKAPDAAWKKIAPNVKKVLAKAQ